MKKTKEIEKQKYDSFLSNFLKITFIVSCVLFAIPSAAYLVNNKTFFKFEHYFKFFLNDTTDRLKQTFMYIIILIVMTVIYTLIIKNREKIFKNVKSIFLFILLVSSIFIITIPFMSSDVFYYLGTGRLDQEYGQNPYYVTIKEFVESGENQKLLEEDSVLHQGYINDWADWIVVYGTLWALICKIIAFFSFGNINIGIFVFKIANILVHMINSYLIYKISNKKKIFLLIYGLCPFVLIEGICSVHNDMFVLMFLLGAIYLVKDKKNIWGSIALIALATAIKYFAILFLPGIVLYHYREENVGKKIGHCILSGIFFIIILMIPYLLYIKDLDVFAGLFLQQTKIAKSIYVILLEYFTQPDNITKLVSRVALIIFALIYVFICLNMLVNKKQIKFRNIMRKMLSFLLIFLFILLTQFQPWYLMWLFSVLIWQKSDNIKLIIQVTILSQFANSIFLLYGEGWKNGTPFIFVMYVGMLGMALLNKYYKENRRRKVYLKEK